MSDGKCIGGGYPPTKEYDVQEGDSMKGVVLLRLYTNRFFTSGPLAEGLVEPHAGPMTPRWFPDGSGA